MLLDIPRVLYLVPKRQQNLTQEESRPRRVFGHLRPKKASQKFRGFDQNLDC